MSHMSVVPKPSRNDRFGFTVCIQSAISKSMIFEITIEYEKLYSVK